MRVLITIGYSKLLFPEDFDAKAAVELLAKGKFVKLNGYGGDATYSIETNDKLTVEFVSCDLPGLPDANEVLNAKILKLDAELSKREAQVYELTRMLETLESKPIEPAPDDHEINF